jgi:hypothetical protein
MEGYKTKSSAGLEVSLSVQLGFVAESREFYSGSTSHFTIRMTSYSDCYRLYGRSVSWISSDHTAKFWDSIFKHFMFAERPICFWLFNDTVSCTSIRSDATDVDLAVKLQDSYVKL